MMTVNEAKRKYQAWRKYQFDCGLTNSPLFEIFDTIIAAIPDQDKMSPGQIGYEKRRELFDGLGLGAQYMKWDDLSDAIKKLEEDVATHLLNECVVSPDDLFLAMRERGWKDMAMLSDLAATHRRLMYERVGKSQGEDDGRNIKEECKAEIRHEAVV